MLSCYLSSLSRTLILSPHSDTGSIYKIFIAPDSRPIISERIEVSQTPLSTTTLQPSLHTPLDPSFHDPHPPTPTLKSSFSPSITVHVLAAKLRCGVVAV